LRVLGEVAPTGPGFRPAPPTALTTDPRLVDVLGHVTRLVAEGRAGEALSLVESTPVAGLGELLRFVREELLDWTWETGPGGPVQDPATEAAVSVVCDAVVAAYHAEGMSRALQAQLLEPWALARGRLRLVPVDLGPGSVAVQQLLSGVAGLGPDGVGRLVELGHAVRRRGPWGPAMHAASWAAYLSGRVRAGAACQLLAVRAVSQLDVPTAATAGGAWNLVSGAVQAAVVADLLDEATRVRLLEPLEELLDLR
jgi:hypothetical protein